MKVLPFEIIIWSFLKVNKMNWEGLLRSLESKKTEGKQGKNSTVVNVTTHFEDQGGIIKLQTIDLPEWVCGMGLWEVRGER